MKIFHKHLSTAHYNRLMAKRGETSLICYFCDIPNPIDHTLNGVQFIEGWGWDNEQPTHADMETIPGAKIANLHKAWERAYGRNPLPIDTILVAGLNNVEYFTELQTRQGVPLDQQPEPVSDVFHKINKKSLREGFNKKTFFLWNFP
jgi:hypothetical protein